MSSDGRVDAAAHRSAAETRRREVRLRLTALMAMVAIGAGAAVLLPPTDGSTELPGDDTLGSVAAPWEQVLRWLLGWAPRLGLAPGPARQWRESGERAGLVALHTHGRVSPRGRGLTAGLHSPPH